MDISYSSALHFLASLQRTKSFGRLPYEDLAPKVLMKTSVQRIFDPKSSQGNRNGYYPKLRKTLDFPVSIEISSGGNILKYCIFCDIPIP